MEENVNHVSVGSFEGNNQFDNQLSMAEKQELITFYLKQLGMMFPVIKSGVNDEANLVMLQVWGDWTNFLLDVFRYQVDVLNAYVGHFFCQQEKELKQVFESQKQKAETLLQPGTKETTYCMTVGESEIYGLTYEQLAELYRVMGLFIEREKTPFECKRKEYDESPIRIGKNINFGMRDDDFFIEYDLDTFESNLSCMSAGQMKRVADTILKFLEVYGENGNREIHWDVADCSSRNPDDEVCFNIVEDSRKSLFLTAPNVQKYIEKEEEQDTEICFNIDVNEMLSPSLSFCDFIDVYRKLGSFLNRSL